MIKITITIDEIDSLQDLCRELFRECMEDEERKESDRPLFGPGVRVPYGADGKRDFRSGRAWRPGSSGCHARRPKRNFDQYNYPGEMSFFGSRKGAEEDPADTVPDGDDASADCFIFEEEVPDEEDSFLRYTLYEIMGRAACADGKD